MERTTRCLAKLDRLNKVLSHEEPDRVPISDFFWGGFLDRWRRELGLSAEVTPYDHYDLDWVVTTPNMDPHIKSFEVLKEDAAEVIVKTGFETTLRKCFEAPMPEQQSWETNTLEKLEGFVFDPPDDPRRFFASGDNQIAGVGDGFIRNSPAWIETVKSLRPDFPVYGSIIEVSECLTRLVGQMNALTWMGEEPERFGAQVLRIGSFYARMAEAALGAADGLLDGFVIWGDVAYRKSLLFSPAYWRTYFKPGIRSIVESCHDRKLPVIFHSCGNISALLPDFIDLGLEAINPLEAKAGLDVVDLRRRYGHRLAFCGNIDIRVLEDGDEKRIRREVRRKLNAAKGGGLIVQSDHSITSRVAGRSYDFLVNLVREYGTYPLRLGEDDEEGI
jgi:hypothetical protein